MNGDMADRVKKAVLTVFEEHQVELFDLAVQRSGPNYHVRITADNPTGGITVEECAWLNRQIHGLLMQEVFPDGRYTLELSSPGADRPLRSKKDFLRVRAFPVRVVLKEPVDGQRELIGPIVDVSETVLTMDAPGGPREVPLDKIQKAEQYL